MISWVFYLILIELIAVSWIDIKIKKISNLWLLINLIFSIVLYFIYPEVYPLKWEVIIFPVGWIVFGFLLFNVNIMGAGDSKFLASLFLVIPLNMQWPVFEKILYSTLVVGLVMLTFKILKDFQKIKAYAYMSSWKELAVTIRSRFSYAPVILLAWILIGVQQWR